MKPIFLRFLFLVGTLVVLVTPFEYSTTIFVGYENGSQVERDCFPDKGRVYCPTLEDAQAYIVTNVGSSKSVQTIIWKSCSRNSTLNTCEPTPIVLSNRLQFTSLSNIALVGATKGVAILCKPNSLAIGAGLVFESVHGLVIENLTLDGCGTYIPKLTGAITIIDCTNATLQSMGFRNGAGLGVAIMQTKGLVNILDSEFGRNIRGILIEFPSDIPILSIHNYYMIDNCTFFSNANRIWGAGMLLYFKKAKRNIVKISRCSFNRNLGFVGGGLHIVIDSSWENSIVIAGCTFSKNYAIDHGGGVIIDYGSLATGNTIAFVDTIFDRNNAGHGGGVVLVADGSSNNTLKFDNCVWYRNTANFTAAAVELLSSDLASSKPVPVFENCQFIGNEAQNIPFPISQSTTQWTMTRGTLVATSYEVHFSESVVFENNTASGIYAVSSLIKFHSGINAKFINNSGINGGAMALRLSSSLQVNTNSTLHFANNSALLRGAAIYADYIDYFSSNECFIHISMDTKNVTITFLENFAGVYMKRKICGGAVFATLLSTYEEACSKGTLSVKLECVGNDITRKDPSFRESELLKVEKQFFNNHGQIANSIPGKEFIISLEIEGEMQRGVDSVFRAFILGSNSITIDPAYSYISTGTLKVYGSPGSEGILVLERIGFPEVYLSVNVLLRECPPGYIIIDNKGNYSRHVAECSCAWNHEQAYQGILKCNSALFQASILQGFWAGYDSEPATPDNLFSAPCPHGFCSYNTTDYSAFHLLPNTASRSELEAFICGTQRTGILCGKCSDNHSVYFHSSEYRCGDNRRCRFGAVFYVISEILPVTVIFITVMIFNISFTSGAVNGFIFFAQVLNTLAVDANGTVHLPKGVDLLTQVYQFIYRFFNLEFFGIDSLSFCLWKGATTLDILAFKYVTVAYALVLVVATIMLMNICSCCFYRVFFCLKPRVVKNSVIHGLSAFLVMCYTQCTLVSLRILTRTFLEGLKTSQAVVFYSGNINYFSKQHMIYAIPALICLATVVAIPPILLLLYPAAWRMLAACHINNETKYIGRVLTMIERFKPLLDSFQSCFKDNFRFFAGLYFIYRLSAQVTYGVAISPIQFYTAVEIQVIIMLILHASVQPYEKRWHNIVDTFLLADLAAINALTMFIYSLAAGGKVHAQGNGITIAAYIQLILIFLPLVYIAVYILIQLVMKLKSVLKGNRETSPPREDNELPARLLGMDDSDDDDFFNYHALHDQHAHELDTFYD